MLISKIFLNLGSKNFFPTGMGGCYGMENCLWFAVLLSSIEKGRMALYSEDLTVEVMSYSQLCWCCGMHVQQVQQAQQVCSM